MPIHRLIEFWENSNVTTINVDYLFSNHTVDGHCLTVNQAFFTKERFQENVVLA